MLGAQPRRSYQNYDRAPPEPPSDKDVDSCFVFLSEVLKISVFQKLIKFSFREMPSKSELKAQVDLAWEETLPGQNSILLTEVKGMLDQVGLNLPNYKVREILDNLKKENKTDGDQLSKVAFESVSSFYHCLTGTFSLIIHLPLIQYLIPFTSPQHEK